MVEEGEDEDRDDKGDEDGATSGHCHRAQELGLGESRGGRPGLPVPNKPDGFCGRKAALKRKAMSVSVRCVAPRPLAVNHRHAIDPCTRTGQQVCVVSCLLSLVNRSVLSVVCFHWSTGGLFPWSTALCCQLSAFTGQRVAYFNGQRVCVVICVVCGFVLSAVCFHWPMASCWQQRGPCCQPFVFTGQWLCIVSRVLSLVNGWLVSLVN